MHERAIPWLSKYLPPASMTELGTYSVIATIPERCSLTDSLRDVQLEGPGPLRARTPIGNPYLGRNSLFANSSMTVVLHSDSAW